MSTEYTGVTGGPVPDDLSPVRKCLGESQINIALVRNDIWEAVHCIGH